MKMKIIIFLLLARNLKTCLKFNKEEECKTQNLKYSEPNNLKISEEMDEIEKYTEEDIKDLIDEAEQEVTALRKRYSRIFNYKSLSEYFISKKYYELKQWNLDNLLLPQYELSNFEEFREFASDPRWKDLISISSQNKIKVELNTKKNVEVLSLINTSLCEFETLELTIAEEKCEIANNFLFSYFPIMCQYFKLTFQNSHKLQIDYYFNSLRSLSIQVAQELYICSWKLRHRQMMTIFKDFKHVRSLKFGNCTIDLESVPAFGNSLEGSNIKELKLDCYDYGHNSYGVVHLIEGLSQSNGFLQNLNKIYISGWGDTKVIKWRLKEYIEIEKLVIKLRSF